VLLPGLALAAETPIKIAPDVPVKVAADQFVADDANRIATFSGAVLVTRGPLSLKADQVVIHYGNGGQSDIKDLVASGNVRISTGTGEDASGNTASFDPVTMILRLSGDVKVSSTAGATMSGPELTIDLKTNKSTFTGAKSGGRVVGVFTPQ
jgi:lipopolysaccharide export system protein LptA